MSENTMYDLREKIVRRLRETLHERTVPSDLPVEKMLGITDIDNVHFPKNETGTLLDPQSDFWKNYESTVSTRNAAVGEINAVIQLLSNEGTLDIQSVDSDTVYVEVDSEPIDDSTSMIETSCKECGSQIPTEPDLGLIGGHYYLRFLLDCPNCEFSNTYERKMTRA